LVNVSFHSEASHLNFVKLIDYFWTTIKPTIKKSIYLIESNQVGLS